MHATTSNSVPSSIDADAIAAAGLTSTNFTEHVAHWYIPGQDALSPFDGSQRPIRTSGLESGLESASHRDGKCSEMAFSHIMRETRLASESLSITSDSRASSSSPSESMSSISRFRISQPSSRPRRNRKPIELAADQPTTVQGRPRNRVYIACVQCRARKNRCDGAKPICHGCSRRPDGGADCSYESAPKRRGPDRIPGSRLRVFHDNDAEQASNMASRIRKQKEKASTSRSSPREVTRLQHSGFSQQNNILDSIQDYMQLSADFISSYATNMDQITVLPMTQAWLPPGEPSAPAMAHTSQDLNNYADPNQRDASDSQSDSPSLTSQPSAEFSKKIWWDFLISLYSFPASGTPMRLTGSLKELAVNRLKSDVYHLFRVSNAWFSFIHLPTFIRDFSDPARRYELQPSLILAALALSVFWQSSQLGLGEAGRIRALRLKQEAQSALDASLNAGFVDEKLAQAAWLLSLFEMGAHSQVSWERSLASLMQLDSIIRALRLTTVDLGNAAVSTFTANAIPHVSEQAPLIPSAQSSINSRSECSCLSATLLKVNPRTADCAPTWQYTPSWNPFWSEAQIRQESCRRLCWSSLLLIAGHYSYRAIQAASVPDLFISNPANFSIMFSGEAFSSSIGFGTSSKNSIWALYDRALLLWHSCMRVRTKRSLTDVERAQFGTLAWLEADALEEALNSHTCNIETSYLNHGREFIFNARMIISYEFQRFIPSAISGIDMRFHRRKAEEWLNGHMDIAQKFTFGLNAVTGNDNKLLNMRPFFGFWLMGQMSRAMILWECDPTLTVALDVCKAYIPTTEYLIELWPCRPQNQLYNALLQQITSACYLAGVPIPVTSISASSCST